MVSRTINTGDAQLGMEETDDGLISIRIDRGGFFLDTTLTPEELCEFGRWIQDYEIEQSLTDSVAE